MRNEYRICAICGRNGSCDPLDRHHVFGGPLRKLSEKFGAVVDLCHDRCHENGPMAVHRCRETADALKRETQLRIMDEQGWTLDDWRSVFGKSYI